MRPAPVAAAPNRSRWTAVCLRVERASPAARGWSLGLRVESVDLVRGGTFARPGDEVEGTAADLPAVPAVGDRVRLEAEYVGGPRAGTFRLHGVQPLSGT